MIKINIEIDQDHSLYLLSFNTGIISAPGPFVSNGSLRKPGFFIAGIIIRPGFRLDITSYISKKILNWFLLR